MATPTEAVRLFNDDSLSHSYVRTSRLFYVDPAEHVLEGWYFKVRGSRYHGPYPSRREASTALNRMLDEYRATNESGGR